MLHPHPISAANAVIASAKTAGISIPPTKLQMLLYFVNGWNLQLRDQPIVEEDFQAWFFGPVLPSIYREFMSYGTDPVQPKPEPVDDVSLGAERAVGAMELALINEVVRAYGTVSGAQLVSLIREPNSAWMRTWQNGVGAGDVIRRALILDEFRLARESCEAA